MEEEDSTEEMEEEDSTEEMEEEDSTEEREEEDSTEEMDKKKLNLKLLMAALDGKLEEVKYCLNGGADKEYKQKYTSMTPLLCAASQGELEVLQYLVTHGCDKQARDQSNNTALHLAVMEGHIQVTQWLIEEADMNPLDRSEKGMTALHLAVGNGQLKITKWLIEKKGLDPTVKTLKGGKTALHLAAEKLRLKTIKWLINKKGMDPTVQTTEGQTTLDLAEDQPNSMCSYLSSDSSDYEENNSIWKKTTVLNFIKAAIKKYQETSAGILPEDISTPEAKGLQDEMQNLSDKAFKDLLKGGEYKCYWNRIFLTGRYGVGKTTLAKILVGDEVLEQHGSTDGIWIYLGKAGMDIYERSWIFLEKGTFLNATVQSLLRSDENAAKQSDTIPSDKESNLKPNATGKERKRPTIGLKNSDIKQPVMRNVSTEETMNIQPESKRKISDDEIIKMVRSQCKKGNYQMTIVPIDLWDFGGQKVYLLTHQLFISSRGTFILIFNGGEGIDKDEKEYLVRWVNSILTYCKTLQHNGEYPKIVFVATHKDKVKGDVDSHRSSLENSIEILFQNHGGRNHLQYQPLTFVNARNKEDVEIAKLKEHLVDVALKHPLCGEMMPTKFVPLELQLAVKVEAKQNIVTMDELKEMNNQNENMALNDDQLELFLKVNHALGKLMYFDVAGLNDKIIIHPAFLVDVLRSIVTEEQFWPKRLLQIFTALKEGGKLLKEDLFEIWKQDDFQEIFEYKDYMVEMLVHLDIICRQKDNDNGSDFFLVPCMISTKRAKNMQLQFDKSIHLAYTFYEEVVPPAILYRFIATFITIWKLQVSKDSRLMLFEESADVNIDKEHDMRFDIQKNRLIITLSHKAGQMSIVSTIASTAQECLTHAITQISNFYFTVTEDSDCGRDLPFTIHTGIVCGTDLCFFKHNPSSENKWTCIEHNKTHETDIVSRWFAKEKTLRKNTCTESCTGLDNSWLEKECDEKHLGRLAFELSKEQTYQMYIELKERNTHKSWEKIEKKHTEDFDININAFYEWKQSSEHATFKNLHNIMTKKCLNIHILCEIVKDFQIDRSDLPPRNVLNLKPLSSDIQLLPNHIAQETFQLGLELGLPVAVMHNIQFKYAKNLHDQLKVVLDNWQEKPEATYEVLVKALVRIDRAGIVKHLTYGKGWKKQLEDLIPDYRNGIIQKLNVSDILDHMLADLMISVVDRRQIEQHVKQDDQNKALIDILVKKKEATFVQPELSDVPDYLVCLQKNYLDIIETIQHE